MKKKIAIYLGLFLFLIASAIVFVPKHYLNAADDTLETISTGGWSKIFEKWGNGGGGSFSGTIPTGIYAPGSSLSNMTISYVTSLDIKTTLFLPIQSSSFAFPSSDAALIWYNSVVGDTAAKKANTNNYLSSNWSSTENAAGNGSKTTSKTVSGNAPTTPGIYYFPAAAVISSGSAVGSKMAAVNFCVTGGGICNGEVPACSTTTKFQCTLGTPSNTVSGTTNFTWDCSIPNGEVTSCSISVPVCNTATVNTCTVGSFVDDVDTATQYKWKCLSGDADETCFLSKPTCGTSNGEIFASAPSSNLCGIGSTAGTVTSLASTYAWSCSRYGGSASCSADRLGTPTTPIIDRNSCTSVSIDWGTTPNATGYNLKRKPASASDSTYVSLLTNTTNTVYVDTGLAGATAYTYKVEALNGYLSTSNTASVTTVSCGQVSCGTSAGGTFASAPSSNLCSTGATASTPTLSGTTYSWTCSQTGYSDRTCTATRGVCTGNTAPNPPVISGSVTVTKDVSNAYVISGSDPNSDQLKYEVEVDGTSIGYLPSSGFINSGTSQVLQKSWSITGQKTIKSRTIDTCGSTSAWATLNITVNEPPLGNPPISSVAKNSCTSVTINWDPVSGSPNYYNIYRSTGSTWSIIASTTSTTYTDTGLSGNTLYSYKISAVRGANVATGNSSSITTDVCVNGSCSTTVVNTCTAGSFVDDVDTATQYKWKCAGEGGTTATCALDISSCATPVISLENKTPTTGNLNVEETASIAYSATNNPTSYHYSWDGGSFATTTSTTITQIWTIGGLTHNLKVKAANACGYSNELDTSFTVNTVATLGTPSPTASSLTCNSTRLNWGAVTGSPLYYEIWRSMTNVAADFRSITTTTNLAYTDSGLSENTRYYYKVDAVNNSTRKPSAVVSALTPNCSTLSCGTEENTCLPVSALATPTGETSTQYSWTCSLNGITESCTLAKSPACDSGGIKNGGECNPGDVYGYRESQTNVGGVSGTAYSWTCTVSGSKSSSLACSYFIPSGGGTQCDLSHSEGEVEVISSNRCQNWSCSSGSWSLGNIYACSQNPGVPSSVFKIDPKIASNCVAQIEASNVSSCQITKGGVNVDGGLFTAGNDKKITETKTLTSSGTYKLLCTSSYQGGTSIYTYTDYCYSNPDIIEQ